MENESPLGKKITYKDQYDPSQLFPIERAEARKVFNVKELPFDGSDIWNCYELSWLNPKGKPVAAMGRFVIPAKSTNIIESKSMKLYLNSFNQSRFESEESVREVIYRDLKDALKSDLEVTIIMPENFKDEGVVHPEGILIDDLDVNIEDYTPDPSLLKTLNEKKDEKLYSNLLRTNCPVTNQPDWATVFIEYKGDEIDKESLLKYLISFRQHSGFHENCVETIYMDIMERCRPEKLLVNARFTRRGGIDINPYRSNYGVECVNIRDARQ